MFSSKSSQSAVKQDLMKTPRKGGTWVKFAGYVPPASKSPYPIIVYPVANCRPYRSIFGANV